MWPVKSNKSATLDGIQVFVLMSVEQFEAGCEQAAQEHLTLADLLRRLLAGYVKTGGR